MNGYLFARIFLMVGFSLGFLLGIWVLFYAYRLSKLTEEEFTSSLEEPGQKLLGTSYKLYIPNLLRKLIIGFTVFVGLGVMGISAGGIISLALSLFRQ